MALILGLLLAFSSVDLLAAEDQAVVFVVDPIWDCVASYVAHVPLLQKYRIIKVMTRLGESEWCNEDHADIFDKFTYNSLTPNVDLAVEEIYPQLRSVGLPIAAIIPTFDPAVSLADRLASRLGIRGNPSDGPLADARHDKFVMSEAVRKAGLRSVKEKVVTTWSEAKEYLESLTPPLTRANPVIFKILRGSNSEGVKKVYSMKQAEEIFNSTVGSKSWFGDKIGQILIQEFLKGKEYVVDSVSRDGVHKVNMVWYEDLRPGNGIFNLYYGFKVQDPQDQRTRTIIDYANNVLTATGLRNGAADMEVYWLEEEDRPCLIDLNARWTALMWHDGLKLESYLTGNNQITATINAYLDGDAFDQMPLVPSIKEHGAMLFTNVFQTGTLRAIPGMAVAEKMPSYWTSFNEWANIGRPISPYTSGDPPIAILLAHKDEAVLDADYNRIIDLETSNAFFDIILNKPSMGYTSLRALRLGEDGLPERQLLTIAALAIIAVAAILAFVGMSRQNVRDGSEYLAIE